MNNSENTVKSLAALGVTEPERWNLVIKISQYRLVYALQGDAAGAFAGGEVVYDITCETQLKKIEEAIYSTPLPGNDFRSVSVVVDTEYFMCVPREMLDDADDADEVMERMIDSTFTLANLEPVTASHTVMRTDIPGCDAATVWACESVVVNFLTRTFYNATFSCSAGEVAYMALRRSRMANTPRMLAVTDGAIRYVAVTDGTALRFVCRYDAAAPEDFVYYVLAAWKLCELDPLTAELLTAGGGDSRRAEEQMLGEYIRFVLPDIFPPQLHRISPDTMNYPFDLMIKLLAICE